MLKNVFLVLFSCVIGLICIEVFLRVFDPLNLEPHVSRKVANVPLQSQGVYFCTGGPNRLDANERVFSRERPQQSYFEYRNDIASYHAYNELGFRGPAEPQDGKAPVPVLGDSFIRGTLSDETETIPAFLSRWSADNQFMNLGTGGHGTLQHGATYQEFQGNYAHDTVLLFVFNSNDLIDNVTFSKWQENPVPLGQRGTFANKVMRKVATLYVGKLMMRFKSMLMNQDLYPSQPTETETDLFLSSLSDLNKAVQANGAQLIVFSLPSISEFVGEDYVTFRSDPVGYSDAVRGLIDQAAKADGFTWFDLAPSIQAAADQMDVPVTDLFGSPDHHLQEIGNYVVASAVAGYLQDLGLSTFDIEQSFVDQMQFAPDNVSCPEPSLTN